MNNRVRARLIIFVFRFVVGTFLGECVVFLNTVVRSCVAITTGWESEGLHGKGQVVLIGIED